MPITIKHGSGVEGMAMAYGAIAQAERERAILEEQKKEQDKAKKYGDWGSIARIAGTAATFVPGLQPVGIGLTLAGNALSQRSGGAGSQGLAIAGDITSGLGAIYQQQYMQEQAEEQYEKKYAARFEMQQEAKLAATEQANTQAQGFRTIQWNLYNDSLNKQLLSDENSVDESANYTASEKVRVKQALREQHAAKKLNALNMYIQASGLKAGDSIKYPAIESWEQGDYGKIVEDRKLRTEQTKEAVGQVYNKDIPVADKKAALNNAGKQLRLGVPESEAIPVVQEANDTYKRLKYGASSLSKGYKEDWEMFKQNNPEKYREGLDLITDAILVAKQKGEPLSDDDLREMLGIKKVQVSDQDTDAGGRLPGRAEKIYKNIFKTPPPSFDKSLSGVPWY